MIIKHNLDRSTLKKFNNEEFFNLVVSIEENGENVTFPSKISKFFNIYSSELDRYINCEKDTRKLLMSNYFRQMDIDYFNKEQTFPFFHLMNDEKEVIMKIIDLKKNGEDGDRKILNNLGEEFDKYTSEITELMDLQMKIRYKEAVKNIFIKCIDNEDDKDLFNLTNFLLHYINWDNSFYNFYETTCDLLFSQLKSMENRFDNTLKTQLRAFLAYHSKVKVLKRFFEKRELGKITTISFLEWTTEIRAFLVKEFEKIFGEQKALEYIMSIDYLLEEALKKKLG